MRRRIGDLAAPARGGRRAGLRVGSGPRARRLERATADQDLALRRPPRLPDPLGGPGRKDLYHRGRGRGHRARHPLRLQARRVRGRHKGRPERPARPRLRQRGRGAPRLATASRRWASRPCAAPPSPTIRGCSASSRSAAFERSAMAPSSVASTTSATPSSSTSAGERVRTGPAPTERSGVFAGPDLRRHRCNATRTRRLSFTVARLGRGSYASRGTSNAREDRDRPSGIFPEITLTIMRR